MMMHPLPALICLTLALGACATAEAPPRAAAPAPIVVADTTEAVYAVRSINRRTRQIALNTPEDRVVTITAGPDVRNFSQIRVGDRVRVRFADSVALSLAPPGAAPAPEAAAAAARSAPGQRPSGAAGLRVTETVRIVRVDPATGRTTFLRPDGVTRSVVPERPDAIAFAKALKPGDMVTVTFSEGVAIQVQPAI
jgi:hypothetical protein